MTRPTALAGHAFDFGALTEIMPPRSKTNRDCEVPTLRTHLTDLYDVSERDEEERPDSSLSIDSGDAPRSSHAEPVSAVSSISILSQIFYLAVTTVRAGQLSDAEVGAAAGDFVYVYHVHDLDPQTQHQDFTQQKVERLTYHMCEIARGHVKKEPSQPDSQNISQPHHTTHIDLTSQEDRRREMAQFAGLAGAAPELATTRGLDLTEWESYKGHIKKQPLQPDSQSAASHKTHIGLIKRSDLFRQLATFQATAFSAP
ncbi:unnamed protein product [Schistocephalus solidus]|uniref:Similar to n=1 Tax=Schistocephalus solidus TaxID=70667 RepID=A0A183T8D4_SCHSO|nr:unnamed protein product [Schistocephalus solidus]